MIENINAVPYSLALHSSFDLSLSSPTQLSILANKDNTC